MKRKVLLVYPGKYEPDERLGSDGMPLPILALAAVVRKGGYTPVLLDTRVSKYRGCLDLSDVMCVGISSMTSTQIAYALEIAGYIRDELDPDMPLVWGGWHATMLPDQTLKSKYVDYVVCGEGEVTFLELIGKLEAGESVAGVRGVSYKNGDEIIDNPGRGFVDLNDSDMLPYDLLDLRKYSKPAKISYQSSRGCPYRCAFCVNQAAGNTRWRAKSAEKIVDELVHILSLFGDRRPIDFVDDNFFVNRKRVEEFCTRLMERKLDIRWTAFCRVDYLSKYDLSFMKLLRQSGCIELALGGESGSPRILEFVDKETTVGQIISAARKCVDVDIVPIFSFMAGFPTETKEDLDMTLSCVDRIFSISDKTVVNGIFIHTPMPGAPLEKTCMDHGYRPPGSLVEWGEARFSDKSRLPWLGNDYGNVVQVISYVSRILWIDRWSRVWGRYELAGDKEVVRRISPAYRLLRWGFKMVQRLRWRYKFFRFPVEWKLVKAQRAAAYK